jgi:hypothetical protein
LVVHNRGWVQPLNQKGQHLYTRAKPTNTKKHGPQPRPSRPQSQGDEKARTVEKAIGVEVLKSL